MTTMMATSSAALGVSIVLATSLYLNSSPWTGLALVTTGVIGYSYLFLFKYASYSWPDPRFWRFVDAAALAYLLYVCYLASLTRDQAVSFLGALDPVNLGKPLPEKNYADACQMYDASNTENPWHNIFDRFDLFVAAHFFGWLVKAWIVRDRKLLWISSVLFELVELSLRHLLPNFYECLWDVLVLDLFGANWLGLEFGLLIVDKFGLEKFRFTNTNVSTARLLVAQVGLVLLITLIDLNLFFIKYLLYIPTSHWVMCIRTFLFAAIAAPATKQFYRFARPDIHADLPPALLDALPADGTPRTEESTSEDSDVVLVAQRRKTQGAMADAPSATAPPTTLVLGLSILATEVLAIVKHGNSVFTESAPIWVKIPWSLATAVFLGELVRRVRIDSK